MRRIRLLIATLMLLIALPASSLAATRALLVACSDFITQPDLGSTVSGNLHMIGSALLGVTPRLDGLSIEDGTIGTPDELSASIAESFADAQSEDLSLLYLCTHGLSSSDDGITYLLLGDGETESLLSAEHLQQMLSAIPGEKLLILDACFSGALIGRGIAGRIAGASTPGEAMPPPSSIAVPFLKDPSIHVLTSASGYESSWYYDSRQLSTGAVSYFASALASGLGLYGSAEADISGDGAVTLDELHRYLSMAMPSSSCQLLSANEDGIALPAVTRASLTRPLSGFSYGESLLHADDPTLDFSFTVTRETSVQYRLIDFDSGKWNWENAKTFLDAGENEDALLTPGRKTRTLTLSDVAPQDSGYLMLQVFALSGEEVILCSERLIAVQSAQTDVALALLCADAFTPGENELPIGVQLGVPAEMTVSVYDAEGMLMRRLCQSQMTRPAPGDITMLYWDGKDSKGYVVPAGTYTVTAEAWICGAKQKTSVSVAVH